MKQVKAFHEMTLDERIQANGWFHGTMHDWERLPMDERERLAFAATGCQVAFPTWPAPVHCLHSWCKVLRGEMKPICVLNGTMRSEAESGWWRYIGRDSGRGTRSAHGRTILSKMYRYYRKLARERKEYDLWKLGGVNVAMLGILAD